MTSRILIFDDYASLSRGAAEFVVYLAREAVAARGVFTLALSGGGTPQGLFDLLGVGGYAGQISWPAVHVFWGDERCVPPDQEGSSYKQAFEAFLGKVLIPAENIHRVKGEFSPEDAAADYMRQLGAFAEKYPNPERVSEEVGFSSDFPRFDMVLLGMGSDGHTASLFPGQEGVWGQASTPVIPVTAHYAGRPAQRVSLTPRVFNAARQVFFLVTGAGKAETLRAVLDGDLGHPHLPAAYIQPEEGVVTWLVDREAAGWMV